MLQDLEKNISALIAAYEQQRGLSDRLQKELEANRGQLEAAKVKIKELEDKVDSLQLRNAFTSSTAGNSGAKAEIDSLIREIDAALELLQ